MDDALEHLEPMTYYGVRPCNTKPKESPSTMRSLLRMLYRLASKVLAGSGIERFRLVAWLNRVIRSCIHTRIVHLDGLTFHLDKEDGLNLSLLRCYEPTEQALFQRVVKQGDTVIDIGANIGYFTVHFSRLVGDAGQVHAFEPDTENAELLTKNIEENSCTNVQANAIALSNTSGVAELYLSEDECVDHRLYPTGDGRAHIEVQTTTLDEYCKNISAPINFIKMDIQGAESLAFSGMTKVLRDNPSLKLLTEFWPYGLNASGSSGEAYVEMLLDAGFALHEHKAKTNQWEPVSKEALLRDYTVENKVHTNLYCTKK